MNREAILTHLKTKFRNKNLFKHMLATEAVMGGLAERLDEDKEKWMMAGLVHDIDYNETAEDPTRHGLLGGEILEEMGFNEDIIYAVKAHNDTHGLVRKTLLDKTLYSSDPLTGLIVAAALITPTKKLEDIDVQFIMNRFHEKSFARGANRDQIASCRDFGMDLQTFIHIGLCAMRDISQELEM